MKKTIKSFLLIGLATLASLGASASDSNIDPFLNSKNTPWTGGCISTYRESPEDVLNKGISQIHDMRAFLEKMNKIAKFNNEVYIALLQDTLTKAVWKPKEGDDLQSALGEVVAYRIAKKLSATTNNLLVPPTILAEYQGRVGSLQWFLESSDDLWVEPQRIGALSGIIREIRDEAALFCFAIGQWDTHPGNYMVSADGGLALIDNEGIVNKKWVCQQGEKHYVGIAFHENLVGRSKEFGSLAGSVSFEEFQQCLGEYLRPERVQRMYKTFFGREGQDASYTFNYMLGEGGVWIQYHAANTRAFPVVSQAISASLRRAYEGLLEPGVLEELCQPLENRLALVAGMQERIRMALDFHAAKR